MPQLKIESGPCSSASKGVAAYRDIVEKTEGAVVLPTQGTTKSPNRNLTRLSPYHLLQRIILWQLYCVRFVLGRSLIKMNFRMLSQLVSASNVLRLLGATVGNGARISSDICVYNLDGYSC